MLNLAKQIKGYMPDVLVYLNHNGATINDLDHIKSHYFSTAKYKVVELKPDIIKTLSNGL